MAEAAPQVRDIVRAQPAFFAVAVLALGLLLARPVWVCIRHGRHAAVRLEASGNAHPFSILDRGSIFVRAREMADWIRTLVVREEHALANAADLLFIQRMSPRFAGIRPGDGTHAQALALVSTARRQIARLPQDHTPAAHALEADLLEYLRAAELLALVTDTAPPAVIDPAPAVVHCAPDGREDSTQDRGSPTPAPDVCQLVVSPRAPGAVVSA